MTHKEKLYIYVRVSTEEQVKKDNSLPRQKQLGMDRAHKLDMEGVIFEEAGQSASAENLDNRPELARLMELVKKGVAKHIFVFDFTRLSRNVKTFGEIQNEFSKHKVHLYTETGRIDMSNPEDGLSLQMQGAFAVFEAEQRKKRFRLGTYSANRKGKFLKLLTPYGYIKDENGCLVVNPEEEKVFLQMVDLFLKEGYGTSRIAKWLNEQCIATKSSKVLKNGYVLKKGISNRKLSTHKKTNTWNPGTINSMFQNRTYIGERKFKVEGGYETVACPSILTQDTFEKLQEVRLSNRINKRKESKYFYLLEGIIQCGTCQHAMHGRIKPNRGEYTYRCNTKRGEGNNCKSRGINIHRLDSIVWELFYKSKTYHKEIIRLLLEQRSDTYTLESQLQECEEKLQYILKNKTRVIDQIKNLLKREADALISPKIFNDVMMEFNTDLTQIEEQENACCQEIESIKLEVTESVQSDSEMTERMHKFFAAIKKFEELKPPFDEKSRDRAKQILRRTVKNVSVEYIEDTKQYRIEVEFYSIGKKTTLVDDLVQQDEPQKLLNTVPLKGSKSLLRQRLPLPPLSTPLHR